MGNVHMEATQINYRGGSKKMGVEEAIKAAGDEIDSLKSGLTNVENELNCDATVYPYADVITIEDAVPSNLAECNVKLEPVQSGSGDPSPTNVRPIVGHIEASVTVADDAENPTVTKTYTIALGDTIYGGTVDFDSGVMTVTHEINVVRSNNIDGEAALSNNITRFRCVLSTDIIAGGANSVCSHFPYLESWDDPTPHFYTQTSYAYCFAPGNGQQEVKAYIEEQYNAGTPITICSKLKNTFTVQLTPQQIQLLKGQNTLTASTGQISVTVNGVSGSIGAVQEQVNGLAEEVAEIKPLNYSTTEQKTGQKWMGKDIYVKVFTDLSATIVYNSWVNIVEYPDVDSLIDYKAYSYAKHIISGVGIEVRHDSTSGYFQVQGEVNIANSRTITILVAFYTKTT